MKNKQSLLLRNKLILILVLGVILRLVLALTTYHSDTEHFYLAGQVIAKGHILDFYDAPDTPFNYPPLVYFFLGPVSYLLSIPLNKLVYLPFDLGISFLLLKLFKNQKEKLWAFGLWVFNPLAIYATYMMGQFDIVPTFLSILALYLAVHKKRYLGAALALGLGASFKIFPFLFLIPLAFLAEKWFDRLKIILLGTLTYFLTIVPFLGSPGFRATALVAAQTTKSLYAQIPISGGEAIVLFPLAILFFYIIFFYSKGGIESLWQRFFILLLVFFIFTHSHPQWLLWLTPFLIIDLVRRFSHWPLVAILFFSWLGLLTFFDSGLTVGLFAPVFPALRDLPGIWEILGVAVDINLGRSLLQTIFVAPAVYYLYYYFPGKKA